MDMFLPVKEGATCDKPKNKLVTQTITDEAGNTVAELKMCLVITKDAHSTSAVIYGGNSGSPVVDFFGNVVGVAFAANNSDNYGEIISLHDLKNFIARY